MSDNKEEQKQTEKKMDKEFIFQLVVVGVLVILLLYNLPVNAGKGVTGNVVKGIGTVSALDILPSGTPEVYGSCEGLVKESANYNPSTPYAVSRAACDMSLMTFFKGYNFPLFLHGLQMYMVQDNNYTE